MTITVEPELTWRCHICKKIRPDDKISVFKKDLSEVDVSDTEMPPFPKGFGQANVRYCNDDINCTEKAKTYNLLDGRKNTDDGKQ